MFRAQIIRSFVLSFVRSFIHSFFHSFIHSFIAVLTHHYSEKLYTVWQSLEVADESGGFVVTCVSVEVFEITGGAVFWVYHVGEDTS